MLINKRSKFAILVILSVLFSLSNVSAQINSSPYSGVGIGEILRPELIHNMGKGGTGLAHGSLWYINTINPAMLVSNTLSTFEVGLSTEVRVITDGSLSQTNVSGNLNYLAFAFPVISNKWTAGLGMNPYSAINYDFKSTSHVFGSDSTLYNETLSGKGGLNQYYLSSGFKIYKGLSFGFKASLIAGAITRDESIALGSFEIVEDQTVSAQYLTGLTRRDYTVDYGLNLGLSYKINIGERDAFTIAAIYDIKNKLNTKRFERLEHRTFDNEYVPIYPVDTLFNNTISNNTEGVIYIPSKVGLGISYQKNTKLLLAADFTMQDWSSFKNFDGNNENLQKSWFAGIGADFTPNAQSAKNYLSRVTYRSGFNYERSPFYYNGTQINEFGINFGASFPVSRLSTLNMAFKYGQRGTTQGGLLLENFYKISFGVTFNDKWFNRRQIE